MNVNETTTTKVHMNPAHQIDHATRRLHAAIDNLLNRVVAEAMPNYFGSTPAAELPDTLTARATVTQIAVDKMLADLETAHPGVVAEAQ